MSRNIDPAHPAIAQAVSRGLLPAGSVPGARKAAPPSGVPVTPREPLSLPELPYPPTVNTYWRHVGSKTLLSSKARNYRRDVLNKLRFRGIETFKGSVELIITFRAPDNRRRDLDNLPKGLLDALKYAGVYDDDSQVRRIDMRFGAVVKGGAVLVTVRQLETQ